MPSMDAALDESYANRHVGELAPAQQFGFYFQFLYRCAFALLVSVYARQYWSAKGILTYDAIVVLMLGYVAFTAVLACIARNPRFRGLVRDCQLFIDMFGIAIGLPHDPNPGLPLLSLVYFGFLETGLRHGFRLYVRQYWSVVIAVGILIFIRARYVETGFSTLDAWHVVLFFAIVTYGLQVFAARDRAITALRETRDRLQLSLEAPGVFAWYSDEPMQRVRMEGNLKRFLGVEPEQFSGLMADYFAHIHPEDRLRFSDEYRDFIKGRALDFEWSYRLVRDGGEVLYVNARAKARRDTRGRVLSISGMVWDLTEQRKQQEALRQMEERYRLTTQSARVGVWVWDALDRSSEIDESLRILFDFPKGSAGHNARLKLTLEEFLENVHPDDRMHLADELRALVKSRDSEYLFGYRIRLKTGEIRDIQSRGTVFRDSAGRALQLAGVTWDATQLMEAQRALQQKTQELERSNKELDDFTYIASHDLKEPLRGIGNYARFLQEDHAGNLDQKGHELLQKLREQAARMETLIQELLHVAHIDRVQLAYEDTDLQSLVQEVLASLEFSLGEKNIEVRIPQPLPRLRCDRVRVGELFRNLITNGMKYNDKPQRWLEIGYSTNGAWPAPTFHVRDNGIGIPSEHRERVFSLFQRLHARTAFGGGTGVGLTIAQKIVRMHGGRIWFESEPGTGTTFYFTLGSGV